MSPAVLLIPPTLILSLIIPQTFITHLQGASSRLKNRLSSGDKRLIRYGVPLPEEQMFWG